MDIQTATASYESWLAAHLAAPLDPADVAFKHRQMADPYDPFPFLRGTYYRWARQWAGAAGHLATAPGGAGRRGLARRELRDVAGRRRPALLGGERLRRGRRPPVHERPRPAGRERPAGPPGGPGDQDRGGVRGHFGRLPGGPGGRRHPVRVGGTPPHLRALALAADRAPRRYWKRLTRALTDPPAEPPAEAAGVLTELLPAGPAPAVRARRRVGMGSLGRPRYVALADRGGSWVAREVKATAPPATAWAAGRDYTSHRMTDAVGGAVRAADPFYRPGPRWVARRLGPHCSRVELTTLSDARQLRAVLASMGAETANVHLGTPGAAGAILADLDARPAGWLRRRPGGWRKPSGGTGSRGRPGGHSPGPRPDCKGGRLRQCPPLRSGLGRTGTRPLSVGPRTDGPVHYPYARPGRARPRPGPDGGRDRRPDAGRPGGGRGVHLRRRRVPPRQWGRPRPGRVRPPRPGTPRRRPDPDRAAGPGSNSSAATPAGSARRRPSPTRPGRRRST